MDLNLEKEPGPKWPVFQLATGVINPQKKGSNSTYGFVAHIETMIK